MFEKEAKERAKDYTDNAKRQVAYECGFLDGVDLGYNKAIVEIKDAYEGNGNFSAWFENYLEGKNVFCKGTGKIETEPKEKHIEELEEKISVLLSCKNCPENKDGLICRKEYENKCLAQKIQFIKELQQENAELKGQVEMSYEVYNNNLDYSHHIEEQLTEAKEVIEELYNIIPASMADYAKEPMEHARKFMTEE